MKILKDVRLVAVTDLRSQYSQELQHVLEHRVWLYRLLWPLMMLSGIWMAVKTYTIGRIMARGMERTRWYYAAVARKFPWSGLLFDGFSPYMRAIRRGATGHTALDLIYNYQTKRQQLPWLERFACDFWVNTRNAQAVRNRRRVVRFALVKSAERLAVIYDSQLTLLSIACGSAQAVIEAAAAAKQKGINIRVIATDVDEAALAHANHLAALYGVSDQVVTERLNAPQAIKKYAGSAHIVEMVGLIDYLDDSKVDRYFRQIRERQPENGVFLTGHIHPNPEQLHTRFVVGWAMLYRSVSEIHDLVSRVWPESVQIVEPHGIHSVLVGHK